MVENTVLISLDRFKQLNDFEHDITGGKTILVYQYYRQGEDSCPSMFRAYTKDEAVKELIDINNSCEKNILELKKIIIELKNPKPINAKQIDRKPNFETMSILQFIKYKWSKK